MGEEIDVWMIFEVLAAEEKVTESSLESHVEKLGNEEGVEITETDFDDVKEVENPHPSLDKGYSQVCEVRCSADDFGTLVKIVLNFGPTMIEVEGPDKIEMNLSEMQDSLNLVAEMMHKFLQAGAGGMMISGDE